MKKLITLMGLLCLIPVAFAGGSGAPSNYYATSMLSEIFGYLPPLTGHMGVMNMIVHKINLAVFGLVGMYCGYSTSMIVYDLFQGGLQGKSNHIMMAGRLALATALLAPLPQAGYYSAYQTLVMQTVVGGVKLANTVWHTAAQALSAGLALDSNSSAQTEGKEGKPETIKQDTTSPVDKTVVKDGDPESSNGLNASSIGSPIVKALLEHTMCMRYSQKVYAETGNYQAAHSGGYVVSDNAINFPGGFNQTNAPSADQKTVYGCGSFNFTKYPDLSSLANTNYSSMAQDASKTAVLQALSILDPVVEQIAANSADNMPSTGGETPVPEAVKFNLSTSDAQRLGQAIASAEIAYANTLQTLVGPLIEKATFLSPNDKEKSSTHKGYERESLDQWKNAENTSFLMAGNFVMQMASSTTLKQNQNFKIKPPVDLSTISVGPDGTTFKPISGTLSCPLGNDVCKAYNSFMAMFYSDDPKDPTKMVNNTSPTEETFFHSGSTPRIFAPLNSGLDWKPNIEKGKIEAPDSVESQSTPSKQFSFFNANVIYAGVPQLAALKTEKNTDDTQGKINAKQIAKHEGAGKIVMIVLSFLSPAIGSIGKLIVDFSSPGVNPFAFFHYIGNDLLFIGAALLFSNSLLDSLLAGSENSKWATTFYNFGAAADKLSDRFHAPTLAVGLYMIATGLFLIYVVPLMPFLYFLFAVIGWFMCVIEAIFAGTIMPILLADPGGQHPFWGRAETAIMLLLNVFLQPALIVLGLICSILMSFVALRLLNLTFGAVMWNALSQLGWHVTDSWYNPQATAAFGKGLSAVVSHGWAIQPTRNIGMMAGQLFIKLLSIPLVISVYALMVYQVMNFCFTMISELPKRVSRWIGIQPHQSQEQQAVQATTGNINEGTGRFSQYYMWQGNKALGSGKDNAAADDEKPN